MSKLAATLLLPVLPPRLNDLSRIASVRTPST